MLNTEEIQSFKRQVPTLASLYEAVKQPHDFEDNEAHVRYRSDLDRLVLKATIIYGNITWMPTGNWTTESNYRLYINLIRWLGHEAGEAKQQLILKILTDGSYTHLLLRSNNSTKYVLESAEQDTLRATIVHPNNSVYALFNDYYYHRVMVELCNDQNKLLLIEKLKNTHDGEILPSFNDIKQLEPFLHLETIRKQIEAELIDHKGAQFKRLVKCFDDILETLKLFPDQRQKALTLAEASVGGLVSFLRSSFDLLILLHTFPDKKEKIKNEIFDLAEGNLERFITDSASMIYFIELFPEHETQIMDVVTRQYGKLFLANKKQFFKELESNPIYFQKAFLSIPNHSEIITELTNSFYELKTLISYLPKYKMIYKKLVIDKISEGKTYSFIQELSNLVFITHHFPELEDELFSLHLNPKNYLPSYELGLAINEYPAWSESLWLYIRSSQRLYAHYVNDVKEQHRIYNLFMRKKDICGNAIAPQHTAENNSIILNWYLNRKIRKYHKQVNESAFLKFNSLPQEKQDLSTLIPKEFRHLLRNNTENHVLNVCSHGGRTDQIIRVLTDGILYPRKESGVRGISVGSDLDRGDGELCFTSPFGSYSDYYITFSTPLLCNRKNYQDKRVIFKFYDWTIGALSEIPLTDKITMRCIFPAFATKKDKIEYIHFEFNITGEKDYSVKVSILMQETMIYDYQGLNQYLRLYIFKILDAIPDDNKNIKNEIYDYFRRLSKEALFTKLTDIAKNIFYASELDFLGRVRFDQSMIKYVTLSKHIINFDEIRRFIRTNDVPNLYKLLSKEETFLLFQRSSFLVNGFLHYATKCEADEVVKFIKLNFEITLDALVSTHRKDILMNIDGIVINRAYELLSAPYADANDKIIWEKFTVYRPNHCAVDTIIKAFISNYVIRILKMYGTEDFQNETQKLDPSKVAMALLFATTGRKSEVSIKDDRKAYFEYRQQSGHYFHDMFNNYKHFNDTELQYYQSQLIDLGNPENKDILHIVMNLSHKALLLRCVTHTAIKNEAEYMGMFFKPHLSHRITSAIFDYSGRLLNAAGYVSFRGEKVKELFCPLAQRDEFENFINLLAEIPEPSLFDLELSLSDKIPLIKLESSARMISKENVVYSISAQSQEILKQIIEKSNGYFGFLYRGKNNDYQSFARCLNQYESTVLKSVLDNLKERYPCWNAGIANELPALINDIESTRIDGGSSIVTRKVLN